MGSGEVEAARTADLITANGREVVEGEKGWDGEKEGTNHSQETDFKDY